MLVETVLLGRETLVIRTRDTVRPFGLARAAVPAGRCVTSTMTNQFLRRGQVITWNEAVRVCNTLGFVVRRTERRQKHPKLFRLSDPGRTCEFWNDHDREIRWWKLLEKMDEFGISEKEANDAYNGVTSDSSDGEADPWHIPASSEDDPGTPQPPQKKAKL